MQASVGIEGYLLVFCIISRETFDTLKQINESRECGNADNKILNLIAKFMCMTGSIKLVSVCEKNLFAVIEVTHQYYALHTNRDYVKCSKKVSILRMKKVIYFCNNISPSRFN